MRCGHVLKCLQGRTAIQSVPRRWWLPRRAGCYLSSSTTSRGSLGEELDESVDALNRQLALEEISAELDVSDFALADDGIVSRVSGEMLTIKGLAQARIGTAVELETGAKALVVALHNSSVSAALLSTGTAVRVGTAIAQPPASIEVPVGFSTVGRVLDCLGNVIDGGSTPVHTQNRRALINKVPSIVSRGPTREPFLTGVKKIDIFAPIGRGQRCALMGARGTGKSTLALHMLANFLSDNPEARAVYAIVGQQQNRIERVMEFFGDNDLLPQVSIVASRDTDPHAAQYLTPYTACALAEQLRDEGVHAAVVYDELISHGNSLIRLGRLTNQALHNNTHMLHSNLLERAARLSTRCGGGSLTAIALIDTLDVDDMHWGADESVQLSRKVTDAVASIVDTPISMSTPESRKQSWPAIRCSDFRRPPNSASQHPPVARLCQTLYHMQIAAREAYASTERMGTFGLDPADEMRLDDLRNMRYWEKIEVLLSESTATGREVGPRGPTFGFERSNFTCLLLTLFAGVHGYLEHIPQGAMIAEYEVALHRGIEEAEHDELRGLLQTTGATLSDLNPRTASLLEQFVQTTTRAFMDANGLVASPEDIFY